jgi:hypothetical protein
MMRQSYCNFSFRLLKLTSSPLQWPSSWSPQTHKRIHTRHIHIVCFSPFSFCECGFWYITLYLFDSMHFPLFLLLFTFFCPCFCTCSRYIFVFVDDIFVFVPLQPSVRSFLFLPPFSLSSFLLFAGWTRHFCISSSISQKLAATPA